jgi:hypothetical protein
LPELALGFVNHLGHILSGIGSVIAYGKV